MHPLANTSRSAALLALCVLFCGHGADASAQERGNGRGDRGRQAAMDFGDADTSATHEGLKRLLQRYPDADANADGELTGKEAREHLARVREQWRDRRERSRSPRPTHADIAYGPEDSQVIDLYLAESDEPTPLVVYFHGGQFITGDEDDLGTLNVRSLLNAGISVASVDYRDTNAAPFPAPFEDGAKALQFLRYYAEQININPKRIAGHGEESGGNIALYLALHDDLAVAEDEIQWLPAFADEAAGDADSRLRIVPSRDAGRAEDAGPGRGDEALPEPWEDPRTAAESTRLRGVAARHPIATFDPRQWKQHKLPMNDHERMLKKYLDVRYLDPVDDQAVDALVRAVSPLSLASSDDPPALLMSQYRDSELHAQTVWTVMRHHPRQSQLIADALKAHGVRSVVRYPGMPNDPGISSVDFFIQILK